MTGTDLLFGLLSTDGSRDEMEMVDAIGSRKQIVAAASYTNGIYAFVAEYQGPEELHEVGAFLRALDSVVQTELHTIIAGWGPKVSLTKTHLRVLEPLLEDPRLSIVDIAQRTGLTARRVRRILREFEEHRAIRFSALIELGAASSLPYIVRITWNEKIVGYSTISDWLGKDYPLQLWETYISASEPVIYALFFADDITEILETVRSIRKNAYVTRLKLLISGHHKYFASYRRSKLIQMIKER
jgi:DNA-binding Lrp family transcriptional regulator